MTLHQPNFPLFLRLWHAAGAAESLPGKLVPLAIEAGLEFGRAVTPQGRATSLGTFLSDAARNGTSYDGLVVERGRFRMGQHYRLTAALRDGGSNA